MKKALIAIGALFVIVLIAALVLVSTFDANRLKPQIAQYVSDHYQRSLKFSGDLSLSVFPTIAIALPALTLSEPGSDTVAAKLAQASVSVRLLPLLRGTVIADTVRMRGLDASIVRTADGRLSIDDLLGPKPGARPQDRPGDGPGAAPAAIELGGIEISDAHLRYVDIAAKRTIALRDLSLKVGRITNRSRTPVALNFMLRNDQPASEAKVSVEGMIDIDLPARRFAARGLEARVLAELTPAPGHRLGVTLDVDGVDADATSLAIATLAIDAHMTQPGRQIDAKLAGPLSGRFDTRVFAAPALSGSLLVEDAGAPGGRIELPVQVGLSAKLADELLDSTIKTRFENGPIDIKVALRGFAKPAIRFELAAQTLDLDKLMPAAAPASPQTDAPAPAGESKPPAAAPIDLSAIDALDLAGQLRVDRLRVRGLELSAFSAGIRAVGGRLDIAPIKAQLYGGSVDASAHAISRGNRLGLAATLAEVSVGPLLSAVSGDSPLDGRGRVRLDLKTAGSRVDSLRHALAGTASLALHDGAIRGIDIAEKLRQARALIGKGGAEQGASDAKQKTEFSSLSVSFAIADGVASSQDLDMKSPLLRVGGEGRIDIGAGMLDYTVRPALVASTSGQGGRDRDALYGVTVPVRLSGPFAAPGWHIDWAAAGKELLKSKAGEKLKEQLAPQVDELKKQRDAARQDLKDKAGSKLRDLFRR